MQAIREISPFNKRFMNTLGAWIDKKLSRPFLYTVFFLICLNTRGLLDADALFASTIHTQSFPFFKLMTYVIFTAVLICYAQRWSTGTIKRINPTFLCITSMFLFLSFVTFIFNGASGYHTHWHAGFAMMMMIDMGLQRERNSLVCGMTNAFEFWVYLNVLSFIIFPSSFSANETVKGWILDNHVFYYRIVYPAVALALVRHYILGKKKDWRTALLLFACMVTVFRQQGGTAIVGATVFVALLIWCNRRSFPRYITPFSFLIVAILIFIAIKYYNFHYMFEEVITQDLGKSLTLSNRTLIWDKTIAILFNNPITGIGYLPVAYMGELFWEWASHTHNQILEILLHGGFISLLLYLMAVFFSSREGIRYRQSPAVKIVSLILCVFSIMGIAEIFHNDPIYYALFILLSRADCLTKDVKPQPYMSVFSRIKRDIEVFRNMKHSSAALRFIVVCGMAVLAIVMNNKLESISSQNFTEYYECYKKGVMDSSQDKFELADKKQITYYPLADTDVQVSWSGMMLQSGNGTPSPSNYRSISNNLYLLKEGRNLIYPSLYTKSKGGLTWTVNKDYSVSINGSCNASGAFNIMTRWLNKGYYRLSGSYGCGSVSIEVIDANNNSLGILTSDKRSMLIWIPHDGKYTVRYIHHPSKNNISAISYPLLTEGIGSYDYTPYESSQIAVSLPDHFGGGTLSSDGTAVITHYKATLTKRTKLQLLSTGDNNIGHFLLKDFTSDELCPAIAGEISLICSALSTSDYGVASEQETYCLSISENQELILTLPFSTVKEAKAWLHDMEKNNQAVVVVYALETPMHISGNQTFTFIQTEGANTLSAPYGMLCVVGYEDTNYTTLPNKPVMTFVDDDGRIESLDTLLRISKGSSVEVSAALVTSYVDDPSMNQYMDWDDILQLRGLGASIHSHTNNYIRLNTAIQQKSGKYNGQYITEETIREDLIASQKLLDENNCDISILVYPHGTLTNETEAIVRDYFSGGVTTTEGINELPINPYRLLSYNLAGEQNGIFRRTYEDWIQLVDQCAATGGWLIWMLHGYSDNFTDEEIEDIISLCLYAESKGVEIMNLEDGFAYMNNKVTVGDINSDSYYIVDRNGTIYSKE